MKRLQQAWVLFCISAAMIAYQNCAQKLPDGVSEAASTGPIAPIEIPLFSTLTGVSTAGIDRVYAVAQGSDLSLYYAGNVEPGIGPVTQQAGISKFSPTGQLLWSKSYGGVDQDVFFSLITTSDGNLLAAGSEQRALF